MSANPPGIPRWRVGFDIGGTFTDFVLFDAQAGRVHLHKRLTSADDPSRSALIGLEELMHKAGITLSGVDGGGEPLVQVHAAGLRVEQDEISEGATDVETDTPARDARGVSAHWSTFALRAAVRACLGAARHCAHGGSS